MNALKFFAKHRAGGPEAPPVEAPPQTAPQTVPQERPATPQQPDPWRRREMEPGEEPAPKAAYGMDTTYTDSAAERIVANLLEDDVSENLLKKGLALGMHKVGSAIERLGTPRTQRPDLARRQREDYGRLKNAFKKQPEK